MLAPLGLRLSPAKTQIVHMSDGFDFLGFHIQWRRKRGTAKWYVYTFIAKRPITSLKTKIRDQTRRTPQANSGETLLRINQILNGWAQYFKHAVAKHTFRHLRRFVWWRIIRWLTVLHRWRWKEIRRRFTDHTGRWLPLSANGIERCADHLRRHGTRLAGASVVVLGVTYKADIADVRMTPAAAVVREMRERARP